MEAETVIDPLSDITATGKGNEVLWFLKYCKKLFGT